MAGDPSGERELAKQTTQSLLVATDVRVHLAVGAVEIRPCNQSWTAVTRSRHVDRTETARADRAIHVGVDEIQARRGAPVTEQPRLDVLRPQRSAEQRIVQQVDLPNRQVVGCAPPAIERLDLPIRQCCGGRLSLSGHGGIYA